MVALIISSTKTANVVAKDAKYYWTNLIEGFNWSDHLAVAWNQILFWIYVDLSFESLEYYATNTRFKIIDCYSESGKCSGALFNELIADMSGMLNKFNINKVRTFIMNYLLWCLFLKITPTVWNALLNKEIGHSIVL